MIFEAAAVEAIQSGLMNSPAGSFMQRLIGWISALNEQVTALLNTTTELARRISLVEASADNVEGLARRISLVEASAGNIAGLTRRIVRVEALADDAIEANEVMNRIVWTQHSRISLLEMELRGYNQQSRIQHSLQQSQNQARRQQVSRRRYASPAPFVFVSAPAASPAPFAFGNAIASSELFVFGSTPSDVNTDA